jgi:hypothetical protein
MRREYLGAGRTASNEEISALQVLADSNARTKAAMSAPVALGSQADAALSTLATAPADFRSSPLDFLQSISDPRDGPRLLQFENLRPAIALHDRRFIIGSADWAAAEGSAARTATRTVTSDIRIRLTSSLSNLEAREKSLNSLASRSLERRLLN